MTERTLSDILADAREWNTSAREWGGADVWRGSRLLAELVAAVDFDDEPDHMVDDRPVPEWGISDEEADAREHAATIEEATGR